MHISAETCDKFCWSFVLEMPEKVQGHFRCNNCHKCILVLWYGLHPTCLVCRKNGASSLPVGSSSMGHYDGTAAGGTCPVGRSCTSTSASTGAGSSCTSCSSCTGCPCCSTASSLAGAGASSAPPSSSCPTTQAAWGHHRGEIARERWGNNLIKYQGCTSDKTTAVSFHMSNSLFQFVIIWVCNSV